MQTLTREQLIDLGYIVEAYDREIDNGIDIEIRYMVTAPDGQLIAEDLDDATSAYNWARWHAAKETADATE